jgi:hypothetical protein
MKAHQHQQLMEATPACLMRLLQQQLLQMPHPLHLRKQQQVSPLAQSHSLLLLPALQTLRQLPLLRLRPQLLLQQQQQQHKMLPWTQQWLLLCLWM